jgi:uncharacterized surface protein with fasciclin (FAS1) repeats
MITLPRQPGHDFAHLPSALNERYLQSALSDALGRDLAIVGCDVTNLCAHKHGGVSNSGATVLRLSLHTGSPSEDFPIKVKILSPDAVNLFKVDTRFATLVTAVTKAGLVDTLAGPGPYTLLLPTDEAFGKLPAGTIEALLNDIPALTDILLYHVIPGHVPAATLVTLESADTALGVPVTIKVEGDVVMINDATVVTTDVEASNGLIHVIDKVLLPPES